MKKLFALALSAVMLLSCFISCAGSKEESGEHVHDYSKTPCTEIQKCKCGETNGNEKGNLHSFTDGICTECDKTMFDELTRVMARVSSGSFGKYYLGSYLSTNYESGTRIRMPIEIEEDGVSKCLELSISNFTLDPNNSEYQLAKWTFSVKSDEVDISIKGMLNAKEFAKSTQTIEYTTQNILSEEDAELHIKTAIAYINQVIETRVIPLIESEANINKITLADLGFVNYK